MITKENKLDHYSLLYRSEYKYDLRYNDVIYADDKLYVVTVDDDDKTAIGIFDKDTLEVITEPVPTDDIKVIKLFNVNDVLYYVAKRDNYEGVLVGTADKTTLELAIPDPIDKTDVIYHNLSYASTSTEVIIAFNNTIYKYNGHITEVTLPIDPNDELIIVSAVNDNIYYGYRRRVLDYHPDNPKKRLNLNIYYIGDVGIDKPLCRLISYTDIDDVRPTSINHDGTNLIVTTSDGYVKLFRPMTKNDENYKYTHYLYKEFVPGFVKDKCNPACTCTYVDGKLLYIGNEVGDIVVYVNTLAHKDDVEYVLTSTTDGQLLIDIELQELAVGTKGIPDNPYNQDRIVEYGNGSYMDNMGNNTITDIIVYGYNMIVNYDGNGMGLYKMDVAPYIDGDIVYNSYIRDNQLHIPVKFKLGHDDVNRLLDYGVAIRSKSDNTNLLYEEAKLGYKPGFIYEWTIKIPCEDIRKYDLELAIVVEDDLGNSIQFEYDIQTLFVDDPIIFDDYISVCYQTAPSPDADDPSVNVDLKMNYIVIGAKTSYKKATILDPGSKVYVPDECDEETIAAIEAEGIVEGQYYCEVEDWDFYNPIAIDTMNAISTNDLDWTLSVDWQGRLRTERSMGSTFNYINIPIEDDFPDKFMYAYRFYNDEGFEKWYPEGSGSGIADVIHLTDVSDIELDDSEEEDLIVGIRYHSYYVYDSTKTVESNFRSRETGDINNIIDFHLLDLIVNCTKMIPLGRSILLKAPRDRFKVEWRLYRLSVDDEGRAVTEYIKDPDIIGIDINEVDEEIRLLFREVGYSSKVTLEVNTVDGLKYWDFSILDDSHINTEELPLQTPNMGNLVFVGRNKFDHDYVADVLRRLSNPVAFAISNEDHKPYEVIRGIDKAGTKISTSQTKQMQMVVSPVKGYGIDDLLAVTEPEKYEVFKRINCRERPYGALEVVKSTDNGLDSQLQIKLCNVLGVPTVDDIVPEVGDYVRLRPFAYRKCNRGNVGALEVVTSEFSNDEFDPSKHVRILNINGAALPGEYVKPIMTRYEQCSIEDIGALLVVMDGSPDFDPGSQVELSDVVGSATIGQYVRPINYKGSLVKEDNNMYIQLRDRYFDGRDSDELFTANYHYFDVYVDGKKLPKEQVTPIKAEHGEFSVRFPYPYDISRSTYIMQCVTFNPSRPHYIDLDGNYVDKRFTPINFYYEMSVQGDDRLMLTRIIKPDRDVEIHNVLRFHNGWIFLTVEDGEVRCNSLKVTTDEDKRDNRECPRFYEVSSDFENETRRIHLINDTALIREDNPDMDAHRMQTYKGSGLDKFHPVEAVLNSTANWTTEEIVASKVITTEEEVQQLYAGEFPVTIDVNGKNLSVSDFVVFVRFLHASYYTRIDRGYFEVTRKPGQPNVVYVKLDNAVLANIDTEIVVTTVDVERTITFNTDRFTDIPYYYLPLVRYDKVGNMQSFYVTDVSKFDVIVDGFTLIPNKDYSLVNCCLHPEIPSMIVFEQGIKPGNKVELNFLDDDVYSTLTFPNARNSQIIEINDNDNLLVSRTFIVFVNGKKLDASQYKIMDRKHLRLLVPDRRNVVIKFLYKNYANMRKIVDLLHSSEEFMNQSESYEFTKMTKFTTEYYNGVDDSIGYGKAYQLLGYADQAFNNEQDVVYDCNVDTPGIVDTAINNSVFYNLDYFNNDLEIDCNRGYNKYDHTLYLPMSIMPEIPTIEVDRFKFTGNYNIVKTADREDVKGQMILEIEFEDKVNADFEYDLYLKIDNKTVKLTPDYTKKPKIEESTMEDTKNYGKYRVCNDRIYHDVTNVGISELHYIVCATDINNNILTLDEHTFNI